MAAPDNSSDAIFDEITLAAILAVLLPVEHHSSPAWARALKGSDGVVSIKLLTTTSIMGWVEG